MKNLKRISLGALLALVSTSVFAADYTASLSVKDITATPGGTGTIDIVLANTDPEVTIIQFNLTVPEGVTPSVKNSAIEKLRNIDAASGKQQDDGSYKYLFETEDEETFVDVNEEGSVVVSIPVEFSSSFAGGEGKLTNIVIAGAKGHKDPELVVSFNFVVGAAAETVSITLDHDVITYCSDKTLDFSAVEGLTASYISEVSGTVAKTTGIGKVAAGYGIILEGATGTYEVPVVSEGAELTDNKLIGVLEETPIEAGNFILMDGVFIPCIAGTLPAGKAYLPKSAVSSDAKVITLVFGESTGINEIQKAETEGAIYNLSGMRVSKTQKGVYIMNGRKVIVK